MKDNVSEFVYYAQFDKLCHHIDNLYQSCDQWLYIIAYARLPN